MTTFISAPFGNYLKFKNAISVTGTWTYKPRPGLFRQIVKKDLAETFTKKLYKGEFPLWKIFCRYSTQNSF